jgi:hypothetical protein
LLQNDGVQPPYPFSIQLSVRPNFSTRLANLAAGAAEGKGLSELISWDEHSDSLNELTEAAGDAQGKGSNTELGEQEGFEDEVEGEFEEAQENPDTFQAPVSGVDLKSGPGSANTQVLNVPDLANGSSDESVAQHNALPAKEPPSSPKAETIGNGTGNGEYDEDGDLIDYSDEEVESPYKSGKNATSQAIKPETDSTRTQNGTYDDFISPCFKPNTCFCSKCNDLLLAEYEAINEELRRRSLSRAAEDNLVEQPAEQTEVVENENDGQGPGVENGVESDNGNGSENVAVANVASEREEPFSHNGEAHHAEAQPHDHDPDHLTNNDTGGNGKSKGDSPSSQSWNRLDPDGKRRNMEIGDENPEDEIQYEDEDDIQVQQLPSQSDEKSGFDGTLEGPSRDDLATGRRSTSARSSLKLGDAVVSEIGTSEQTPEAPTGVGEAPEDEIDYDDDEEEQNTSEAHEPVSNTKEPPVPLDGSGKRQREDADLDEGMGRGAKGMCAIKMV